MSENYDDESPLTWDEFTELMKSEDYELVTHNHVTRVLSYELKGASVPIDREEIVTVGYPSEKIEGENGTQVSAFSFARIVHMMQMNFGTDDREAIAKITAIREQH